jgi:cytochrome c oxidase subunit 2
MPISSPFNAVSAQAQAIADLFGVALIAAAAILALVTGLVLYASFRFRSRPGTNEPRQTLGNRKLEIGWTVAPALLLAALFVLTLNTMQFSDPPSTTAQGQPDLVIIGHQWWWEVRYPGASVVTANEIHIPSGRKLLAQIESADVIHDFWVPQLGRKMDATPGYPTQMWIEADVPGTYLGTCAEYCGAQHAWMRIRVIAQTPAEFDAWVRQQAQVPETPATGDAAQGAQLFQDLTCRTCHTIAGTEAKGRIGPDLTHLSGRETLGAGVLDNTPDNLARWLTNPQAIKPGSYMPNLNLTYAQARALAAYLEALK